MGGRALALALVVVMLAAAVSGAVPPGPVLVTMDAERFDISAEGNTVSGRRYAPVPYDSLSAVTAAVRREQSLPASVRLVRAAPPQMIDYVFCVTDDGTLIVGEQVRSLHASNRYVFTEGSIKRAYPALEATVPWTWIVDIPLGREVMLTLEVKAVSAAWPVHAVDVTPRLTP